MVWFIINNQSLLGMATQRSLRGFATITLVMQIFFGIIYAFEEGYAPTVSYADFNGLLAAVFLCMLLLVGFGLLTVYLKEYAISGLMLNFIMLAFTIQWYFLLKKFWYAIKLTDTVNNSTLGSNPSNIRLAGILKYSYADPAFASDVQDMQYFTLSQAICCAISMFVIFFPLVGRVGPAEVTIICLIGVIGYTLNEAVFWRLNINDNGYGMKIFLFGSVAGIIAALITGGRQHTIQHQNYTTTYQNQTLALVGSIIIWILLPWLSFIDQSQADSTTFVVDFRQIAPLNIMYALSSSASLTFATSIWMRGKISIHDIVFSSFTGGIAYASSSNVFPNPWPAMLIGSLAGFISTYLNAKKKLLNQNGVVDSLGVIFIFLIPSFAGGIYSAMLYATTAYGPNNDLTYVQADGARSRWAHGGYQIVGVLITLAIGALSGVLIGALMKIFNKPIERDDFFSDDAYFRKDGKKELQQTKVVKVR